MADISKGRLEVILAHLKCLESPKVSLEQYPMDSKIGAEVLWNAFMIGDISGKKIADLGCGTGILGIGALILGAKEVLFLDLDEKSVEIAKINLKIAKSEGKLKGKAVFLIKDVKDFDEYVDTIIENPPFGVQKKGNDRIFLKKATENSEVVYHFGKIESDLFINRFVEARGLKVRNKWKFDYPIKSSYNFHNKRIHRFRAVCWRIGKDL